MGMMKTPNEPLEYLAHYPPTDRWRKFFIGVRWLGPDLSFFKNLKQQQGARTSDCMKSWGTEERKDLATVFGCILKEWLRWPTPYFLPEDKFGVIAGGAKFQMVDCLEFEGALRELEKFLGRRLPDSFWQVSMNRTFGEVVDEILRNKGNTQQAAPADRR